MVNVGPLPRHLHVDGMLVVLPAELTDDDRAWVADQLAAVDFKVTPGVGQPPADTSWITTEKIRG